MFIVCKNVTNLPCYLLKIRSFYSTTSEPVLTYLICILDHHAEGGQRDLLLRLLWALLSTPLLVINPMALQWHPYDEH